MDRRTFLKAGAGVAAIGVAGGLSSPALSQGAAARTLRFVPQANLANFDPIWTTQYVVRNASVMVWDTLYGLNTDLQPSPQMCAGHEIADNGLTWRFTLRDGLSFHDGEPVRGSDCVASRKACTSHLATGCSINVTPASTSCGMLPWQGL